MKKAHDTTSFHIDAKHVRFRHVLAAKVSWVSMPLEAAQALHPY